MCLFYRPWIPNIHLQYYIGIPFLVIVLGIIIAFIVKTFQDDYVKSSILQSLPTLTLTNVIASATGTVLASSQVILQQSPIILVFYPAMISTVGGQGSVLANTTSTKLHLGSIKPSISFFKTSDFIILLGGILTAGFIMNLIYSLFGTLLSPDGISFSFYWLFLLLLIITNLLGVIAISILLPIKSK